MRTFVWGCIARRSFKKTLRTLKCTFASLDKRDQFNRAVRRCTTQTPAHEAIWVSGKSSTAYCTYISPPTPGPTSVKPCGVHTSCHWLDIGVFLSPLRFHPRKRKPMAAAIPAEKLELKPPPYPLVIRRSIVASNRGFESDFETGRKISFLWAAEFRSGLPTLLFFLGFVGCAGAAHEPEHPVVSLGEASQVVRR